MNGRLIRRILFGLFALAALWVAGQAYAELGLSLKATVAAGAGVVWAFMAITGSGCG